MTLDSSVIASCFSYHCISKLSRLVIPKKKKVKVATVSGEASKYPIDASNPRNPSKYLYLLDKPSPGLRFIDISTSPTVLSNLAQDHDPPDTKSTKSMHMTAELHTTAREAAQATTTTPHLRPPRPPAQQAEFLSRNRTHLVATTPGQDSPRRIVLRRSLVSGPMDIDPSR
jgi:hypothetical protein